MSKVTCYKLAFSCLAFVVFIVGALSCTTTESTPERGSSVNSARDGAQTDVHHIDGIIDDAALNYELN